MEIKNRIASVRKALKMTQDEFAKKIGVARNTVANYETGNRTPKAQTLLSISREFRVNINWLKTGEGEMFISTANGTIDELAIEYGLDELDIKIIAEFINLNPSDRKIILNFLKNTFSD